MYERLIKGEVPAALDIPTGLGKTSIIPIWFIALSDSLRRQSAIRVPMRLVYIVDRRVIVDQASDTARQIAEAAKTAIADPRLSTLNVSTLRGGGGTADSRDWLRNPDKPAIIIGTVDMVGSRLFFSGYSASKRIQPFYAGMLGQDSLIVLDETHLSPALERSLLDMKNMSMNVPQGIYPSKILIMSATRRPVSNTLDVLSLDDDDLKCESVRDRYNAQKNISLVDIKDGDLSSTITAEACNMTGRTIVYVQKPSDAARITKKLQDKGKDAVMLTGTLRGFERDRLTGTDLLKSGIAEKSPPDKCSEIFRRFVQPPDQLRTQCYLVSTSAGEVGADFDADDMVSDLTTFDSLVQRLGRVNRSGKRTSKAVIVYSESIIRKNKSIANQLSTTLEIIKELTKDGSFDASPHNLTKIPVEQTNDALSPTPEIQPLTQDIVDMWSMTSIYEKYAPRPAVHHWLRGHEMRPIPETYVAWRDDVDDLSKQNPDTIDDILDKYPILPHEIARDYASNVENVLKSMSTKHPLKKVIIKKYNSLVITKEISKIDRNDLPYATILLPCDVGGLDSNGALGSVTRRVSDVADDITYKARNRIRVSVSNDDKITLDEEYEGAASGDDINAWTTAHPEMKLAGTIETKLRNDDDEEPVKELRYYVAKPDSPYSVTSSPQLLSDHHDAVKSVAESIVGRLGLDGGLADAVVLAAEHHDRGKSHRHWQECMHCDGTEALAKTGSRKSPLNLGGFRHEFESVLQIASELDGCEERDLVLHLIAAHHGWARPCFRPNASTEASDNDHLLVMSRYASLQKRFGPWGLAWLEGLLRGADWQASEMHGGNKA